MEKRSLPVEVSARHIHLSAEHLAVLFGPTAKLQTKKTISQPGQFAAEEMVDVVTTRGKLTVRVVGPTRSETQVELTASDCRALGLPVVLRVSGTLEGTPGVTLDGPYGSVELTRGVIVAQRHLHVSPTDAAAMNLKHGDVISVRTTGTRPVTFHDVFVRSREGVDELSFMIDTDEANAAGIMGGETGEVV
jgi:putative phosphotransacetylase